MSLSAFPLLAQINYSNIDPCPLGNGLTCISTDGGAAYIQSILMGPQGITVAFTSILFAMLVFYGIRLLLESRNENAITETKQAYVHILAGAVLVGGAVLLANTFVPNDGSIINETPFNTVMGNVIKFTLGLIATVVILNVVIQGIRLVVAQEDGDIDTAKKRLLHGMIGAGIAILAIPFVRTFTYVETAGGGGVTFGGMQGAVTEIVGIGHYLTLILGALSVVGIIVAGVMLVVSVDEGLKDRARKLILVSLVTLAVTLTAYGIVEVALNTAPDVI